MQTKSYQRFIARIADYEADIELANVLLGKFITGTVNSESTIAEDLGVAPATHIKLNSRLNTHQSRKIVGLHLKKTLYGSFMKDLYEDFGEFLKSTLEVAALAGFDPQRFVGEAKIDMKMADLLATGSWGAFVRLISDGLFRTLEKEKSTLKLLDKFNKKLELELQDEIIKAAMPYLDARHKIVHSDGVADATYKRNYPAIRLVDRDRIKLDFLFINNARSAVCALAHHVDLQVQAKNLCRADDLVA